MGGPWSTLFGHINQIPLMEIFLLFVSHCVPSLSLVNSFLKNTQTLFLPFSENLPQNYPPFKRVFLAKENFLPICPLWHGSLLLGFDYGCHEGVAMVPPSISLNLNTKHYFLPHCSNSNSNSNSIFATFLRQICKLCSQAFCINSCSSLFLQISKIFNNNKLLHLHNH
jgi:hypothetical protein